MEPWAIQRPVIGVTSMITAAAKAGPIQARVSRRRRRL